MTPRLIVCDVDGTLVDKAKRVTDASVAAIARARAAGWHFAIISARPRSGMLPVLDRIGFEGQAAAFNGGLIFAAGGIAFHETIDPDAARAALRLGDGVDTWVFADDRWYASDGDGPHTASERITANQEPVTGTDVATLAARADKITFVDDDAPRLAALAGRVAAAVGDRATVAQSQTYYLDVTARAGNKGDGLRRLAEAAGVDLAATVAIGDQHNDLPMIRLAGYGIAMGNAPDDVKAAADWTTAANDADGVARAIDHILDRSK